MSDPDEATEGQGVAADLFPPISRQLRAYQTRTGDSQHRLSRRSAESGHQVTQRYLGDVVNGKAREWPRKPVTFSSLARAIETSELAVVLGFATEFGVPVHMSEFATRLPPRIDELDESVKESLLGLLWAVTTGAPARRYLIDDDVPDADALGGPGVVEGPERRIGRGDVQQ